MNYASSITFSQAVVKHRKTVSQLYQQKENQLMHVNYANETIS